MRKSLVEKATGKVINVIEIEEEANWSPPEGCILMDGGEIGDVWDGRKWIKTEPIVPEPVRDLATEIDKLQLKVAELEKKVK